MAGQKTGDETLIFMYDNNGDAFGFIYNGEEYYYIKNVQNDIVAIADKNGTVVANYYYDAWGNVTQITGNTALAQTNPLRYRSYYYDSETGYYHLKSRYYSPEVGRFLNADGYAQTGQGLLDKNMFAYCGNNPVNRVDKTGAFWKQIGSFFTKTWNRIKSLMNATFGAEFSTTSTIKPSPDVSIGSELSPITVTQGSKHNQTISKRGNSSKPLSVYANKDASHPIKSSSAGIKINIFKLSLVSSRGFDNTGITASITNGNTTNSLGVKINLSELKVGIENSTTIRWDDETDGTDVYYTNVSANCWYILAAVAIVVTGQQVPAPTPAPAPAPAMHIYTN